MTTGLQNRPGQSLHRDRRDGASFRDLSVTSPLRIARKPALATRLPAARIGRRRPQAEENRSEHMPAKGPEKAKSTAPCSDSVEYKLSQPHTSCVAPQIIT